MEQNLITSEEASIHYQFFNFSNQNVLDLGCGRYGFDLPLDQYTPIYFGTYGANKVVGVDGYDGDIEFYNSLNLGDKFTFIQKHIQTSDDIKSLIDTHQITAIKCDIEGDERFLESLSSSDMTNVVEITIEYHSFEMKDLMYSKLQEWGFVVKKDLNFANTVHSQGVVFASK